MTPKRVIQGAAVTALLAAVTVSAQDIRITQEVMTTNPIGGPGPGGGLNPIPQGTGLILGQVVDAAGNGPVAGALVTLNLPASRPIRSMADPQGRFVFRDLPKGRYSLTASKPGHVDGAYGRLRPSGPTLTYELGDGERASGVSIAMWKYAAIAGYVQDELGEPIVGTTVRVLRRQIVGGQWRFQPGAQDQTDDRGAYRITTLEPGEYAVAVAMASGSGLPIDMMMGAELDRFVTVSSVRVAASGGGEAAIFMDLGGNEALGVDEGGRPITYPTQFFSNAASAVRSTLVKLASGEERSGVDFQLKPVRAFKISGTVSGPEGPLANLALTLVPAEAEQTASAFDTRTAFAGGTGTFTFTNVPPGQYILRATRTPRAVFGGPGEMTFVTAGGGGTVVTSSNRVVTSSGMPPLPTEPTLWTEMPLSLSTTDLTDLAIMLRPGLRVTGTVQFDGAAQRPESDRLPSIGVVLEPADVRPGVSSARGRIETSGQFATMGVPPGRYFVRAQGAPQGWTFRGASLGGRDVTDTAIDIDSDVSGVALVFTDQPIELSGRVTGDSTLTDNATVLLFPTDQSAWVGYGSSPRRLKSVRADKTGAFNIGNLPAGEYYLAAVTEKTAGDWQNPEFLASLVGDATRIRLSDGQKLTQNVKVLR